MGKRRVAECTRKIAGLVTETTDKRDRPQRKINDCTRNKPRRKEKEKQHTK